MAKEITFGVLPYFKGLYEPGTSYSQLNQVVYNGSTYQSKIDNNTTTPADPSGEPTANWDCVSRGNSALLEAFLKEQKDLNARLVAENDSLRALVDNAGHHKAMSYDAEEEYKICGCPVILKGHGTPSAETIPEQKGIPAFIGQEYINLDASASGKYYAVGTNSVSDWKNA